MYGPKVIKPLHAEKRMSEFRKLKNSLSRSSSNYDKLCRKIENSLAGLKGEKETEYQLNFLSEDFVILHNIKLVVDKDVHAQIDHLVLSPHATFIIDTKHWNNDIEVDSRNDWYMWKTNSNGKKYKEGVKSPAYQLFRHKQVLSRFMKKFGSDNGIELTDHPIITIVVMANEKTVLSDVQDNFIVKVDAIAKTIEDYVKTNNTAYNSIENILSFGNYLLKKDSTNENIFQYLNLSNNDVIHPLIFSNGTEILTFHEWLEMSKTHWQECVEHIESGSIMELLCSIGDFGNANKISDLAKKHNSHIVLDLLLNESRDRDYKKFSSNIPLKSLVPMIGIPSIVFSVILTLFVLFTHEMHWKDFTTHTVTYILLFSTFFIILYKVKRSSFLNSIMLSLIGSQIFFIAIDYLYAFVFGTLLAIIQPFVDAETARIINYVPVVSILLILNFLLGILIVGIPKLFKKIKKPMVGKLSYGAGVFLVVTLFFASYSNFQYGTSSLLSLVTKTPHKASSVNTLDELPVAVIQQQAELKVALAMKEDVGKAAFYLNPEDMKKYNLADGNNATITFSDIELILPAYSREHVPVGQIRMQADVRSKLGVSADELVTIVYQ